MSSPAHSLGSVIHLGHWDWAYLSDQRVFIFPDATNPETFSIPTMVGLLTLAGFPEGTTCSMVVSPRYEAERRSIEGILMQLPPTH
jgi:hypothetical protein